MLGLLVAASILSPRSEKIPYCTVEGKTLTMNVFFPKKAAAPTPVMVDIHGGWFIGGGPADSYPQNLEDRGVAFFSIVYRLGDQGGFPQCIRDCRNAIRFIRKNAVRFHIDPNRIAVMGGSAGGHLSLMVAMVPEKFDDGGPTPGLEGVSASVCGAFSWIPPTDLVRFWKQGPSDEVIAADGTKTFRHWNDNIPNDARPHLRSLFHGVSPDAKEGEALYARMSPMGHVRKDIPPVMICDGEHDPIVPGLQGKALHEKLKAIGADSTYWMSPNGHDFPAGDGFGELANRFLDMIFKPRP